MRFEKLRIELILITTVLISRSELIGDLFRFDHILNCVPGWMPSMSRNLYPGLQLFSLHRLLIQIWWFFMFHWKPIWNFFSKRKRGQHILLHWNMNALIPNDTVHNLIRRPIGSYLRPNINLPRLGLVPKSRWDLSWSLLMLSRLEIRNRVLIDKPSIQNWLFKSHPLDLQLLFFLSLEIFQKPLLVQIVEVLELRSVLIDWVERLLVVLF